MTSSPITFIRSQLGGQKLVYEGYSYVKYKESENSSVQSRSYWRCDRSKSDCKCPTIVSLSADQQTVLRQTKPHSHGPDPSRIELARLKEEIREAALLGGEKPSNIVKQTLEGASEEFMVCKKFQKIL